MYFKLLVVEKDTDSITSISSCVSQIEVQHIDIIGILDNPEIVFDFIRIHMPDIVLLNIETLDIEYLDILKQISNYYTYIEVILSGTDTSLIDLNSALQFNIFEFIQKPFTPAVCLDVLKRACIHLQHERDRELELIELRSKLNQKLIGLKGHLLTDTASQETFVSNIGNTDTLHYIVFIIKVKNFKQTIKGFKDPSEIYSQVMQVVESIVRQFPPVQIQGIMNKDELFIVNCCVSHISIHTAIYRITNDIHQHLESEGIAVSIGIGSSYTDMSDSNVSYLHAKNALEYIDFPDFDTIIRIDEIPQSAQRLLPFEKANDLLAHLERGYRDQAIAMIDALFADLNKSKQSLEIVKREVSDFIHTLYDIITKNDDVEESMRSAATVWFQRIADCSSVDCLCNVIKDIIGEITKYIYCDKKVGVVAIINDIQNYVKLHYVDCISLGSIAEKFNISIAYLSRSFKKIVGMKYCDYVNTIRMEKAAEKLLQYPELMIKDIAEMVGFEDQYYFMKRFKIHFSMTPSEYRTKK